MTEVLIFLLSSFLALPKQGHTAAQWETVDFCQMVRTPEVYDGKTVIFTVTYAPSEEGSIVFGECKKSTSEDDVIAQPVFGTDYKHGSSLDNEMKVVVKKRGSARVTFLAKFIDGKSRVFGHQNCCRYRVEIQKILEVRDPKTLG